MKLGSKRAYAKDVADWCARELAEAKGEGHPLGRAYVQNIDLIIEALREYAARPAQTLSARWINVYATPSCGDDERFVTWFASREEADAGACANRFACIQIPEITEGDGL